MHPADLTAGLENLMIITLNFLDKKYDPKLIAEHIRDQLDELGVSYPPAPPSLCGELVAYPGDEGPGPAYSCKQIKGHSGVCG